MSVRRPATVSVDQREIGNLGCAGQRHDAFDGDPAPSRTRVRCLLAGVIERPEPKSSP